MHLMDTVPKWVRTIITIRSLGVIRNASRSSAIEVSRKTKDFRIEAEGGNRWLY